MTTIYLMRHSEPLKWNNITNSDSLQIQNEKWPLSINGERLAMKKSQKKEFKNFDIVFSSKYVRAISTAKYFTNDNINILEEFCERKFGIDTWEELPLNFDKKQFQDFNYKIKNGESLNDVIKREEKAFNKILENFSNSKILIVGHSTAIAALLTKWCQVKIEGPYIFKNKAFFDGQWNFCETFKLVFDNNKKLIAITNIK